jgi:protease II
MESRRVLKHLEAENAHTQAYLAQTAETMEQLWAEMHPWLAMPVTITL